MSVLAGYPEIERKYRKDGSPEALRFCWKPVVEQLDGIIQAINKAFKYKNLKYLNLFLFQSRALGTCKPQSDIDIYIQLHPRHKQMVIEYGVPDYKGTGKKIICGEWGTKFWADLPDDTYKQIKAKRIDWFMGYEEVPPCKSEYAGHPYYVNLKDLKQKYQAL